MVAAAAFAGACNETALPPAPSGPASAVSTAALSATVSAMASSSALAPMPAQPPPTVLADAKVLPHLEPLPPMDVPADNAPTEEKIALGKTLFFDQRLGKDGKFACEGCHYEDKGWADASALSKKADGSMNKRHTPTLINVGYQKQWYWDGRAASLEAQILAAWKGQMGVAETLEERVKEVGKVAGYSPLFKAAFGSAEVSSDRIVKALASFVRTVRSGDSPFDKFDHGDKTAISADAARGWEIFRKIGCASCHAPPLFTDLSFHNVGIGAAATPPDLGRGAVTKDEADNGRFKTPTLRSVATNAPYFHDGSGKTLEDAVDYMLSGGPAGAKVDGAFKKVTLKSPSPASKSSAASVDERADLLAFLRSITPKHAHFERPKLP